MTDATGSGDDGKNRFAQIVLVGGGGGARARAGGDVNAPRARSFRD